MRTGKTDLRSQDFILRSQKPDSGYPFILVAMRVILEATKLPSQSNSNKAVLAKTLMSRRNLKFVF